MAGLAGGGFQTTPSVGFGQRLHFLGACGVKVRFGLNARHRVLQLAQKGLTGGTRSTLARFWVNVGVDSFQSGPQPL